ncbi:MULTISPECIES: hypothetical protein [Aerosakkonema]|uniref:hypothetical protein n=1 Tax=Aerosakkonema TaxID=1246629 RepID=UPI0035BA7117
MAKRVTREYISRLEAAKFFGVSRQTIWRDCDDLNAITGQFPPRSKLNREQFKLLEQFRQWCDLKFSREEFLSKLERKLNHEKVRPQKKAGATQQRSA